jgi:hypothetical protein
MSKEGSIAEFARAFIAEVEALLPGYNASPEDFVLNKGNVAVAVIGPDGEYFGRMFGAGISTSIQCARVAMKKATQVWVTGLATGEFERKAFSGYRGFNDVKILELALAKLGGKRTY